MSSPAGSPALLVKLRSRREVAARTIALEFDKPPGFDFKAGQFAEISWSDPIPENDAEGPSRAFSIASAPGDDTLLFATRLRDTTFKRALPDMPLGALAKIDGPFGDLTLHNNVKRPAVLMAGGIGITPFRSIARRAAQERLPHRILLFYANRRPEDAPFLDELAALTRSNLHFTFVATMTAVARLDRSWTGDTGYFTPEMLAEHLGRIAAVSPDPPIYYIAGPPRFVSGVRAMLNNSGVDDDDIRAEEFEGY